MAQTLYSYLAQDRRRTLACDQALPDRSHGAALSADISGFTALTEQSVERFGARRGIEDLTRRVDAVYDGLSHTVERHAGSVVGFAGDAITCWFGESGEESTTGQNPSLRAVATAVAMQAFMLSLPDVSIKVAVTSGPARRFVVGDPLVQLLDTLAGETIARLAAAGSLTRGGEVIADAATVQACGDALQTGEWRHETHTGQAFAVVSSLTGVVDTAPWLRQAPDIPAEKLRAWILPNVYSREQNGLGEFLTELRPAVALFLRFDGIDYERDELAGQKLDALIRRVQRVTTRYEGTLLQLTIGDKGSYLYLCFGAPTAHEDDVRRAVEAALALREIAHDLTFLQPVQIGITRGTLRVGAYGGATRRTYGALGDEVNIAARLMSAAAPGEVLLTERAQQDLGGHFAVEPCPPLPLKGKVQAVRVFSVVGMQHRRATGLLEPSYPLPMVGRREELGLISDKLEIARRGRGQVVGITAEAGMGKSRLVAEAIDVAQSLGFGPFAGACESSGTSTPYLAWRAVWQGFFGLDSSASVDQQVRKVEGVIRGLAPERVQAMPLLSTLLDLPVEENDFTRTLEPKDRRNALEALLEECLKAAAEQGPILFVLEDIHWIDPLSRGLLERLAWATARSSVCLMLAYRPPAPERSQAPSVEDLPQYTTIMLSELSPAEARQLVQAKAAQLFPGRTGGMPGPLVEQLIARAQGNPFFLEELLNYLHDRAVDPWSSTADTQEELPSSLHTLILSRVDRLTESQKAILKVASIIGRLFPLAWLHGYYPALGEHDAVRADLAQMARLDITPLDTPDPEPSYLFKHIVTQEVAYQSLAYATRARLHEQLARYLEAEDSHRHLDLVAFHYGRSENTDKQREYLRKAGRAAQASYANAVAIGYYERLLRLLPQGDRDRIDILLELGRVLQLVGQWTDAEHHFREALARTEAEVVRDRVLQARCEYALGNLMVARERYAEALALFERARFGFTQADDRLGLAQALAAIAGVYFQIAKSQEVDLDPASEMAKESIEIARGVDGGQPVLARALGVLANIAMTRDDAALWRSCKQESLAILREIGDKQRVGASLYGVAMGEYRISEHRHGAQERLRPLLEESLTLHRQIGDRAGARWPLGLLGWFAIQDGQYATARAYLEESVALSTEQGSLGRLAAVDIRALGVAAYLEDDFAAAQGHFEQALSIFRAAGDRLQVPMVLLDLALTVLEQGDIMEARRRLSEGLALVQASGAPTLNIWGLIAAARLAWVRGQPVRAARLSGAVEALWPAFGPRGADELEYRAHARTTEELKQRVEAEQIATGWAEGQAMTMDEAVAFALEEN